MRVRPKRDLRWLRVVLICFFSLVFLVSAGMITFILVSDHNAESAHQALRAQVVGGRGSSAPAPGESGPPDPADSRPPSGPDAPEPPAVDFDRLRQINPETVGWLAAEGPGVDYPVLQADNNDYYLNHLYNGERNYLGSLFVDYRNRPDFSDQNTVIYGHYTSNGTMFGRLEEYRSQEFYDAFPSMTLYTPGGEYRIELICGTLEDGDRSFVELSFATDEAFLSYVERFRARSTFRSPVEVRPGDRLVSLCTCSFARANARYLLIGRLVELSAD